MIIMMITMMIMTVIMTVIMKVIMLTTMTTFEGPDTRRVWDRVGFFVLLKCKTLNPHFGAGKAPQWASENGVTTMLGANKTAPKEGGGEGKGALKLDHVFNYPINAQENARQWRKSEIGRVEGSSVLDIVSCFCITANMGIFLLLWMEYQSIAGSPSSTQSGSFPTKAIRSGRMCQLISNPLQVSLRLFNAYCFIIYWMKSLTFDFSSCKIPQPEWVPMPQKPPPHPLQLQSQRRCCRHQSARLRHHPLGLGQKEVMWPRLKQRRTGKDLETSSMEVHPAIWWQQH